MERSVLAEPRHVQWASEVSNLVVNKNMFFLNYSLYNITNITKAWHDKPFFCYTLL